MILKVVADLYFCRLILSWQLSFRLITNEKIVLILEMCT